MFRTKTNIDKQSLDVLIAELKELGPKAMRDLRKDIRNSIKPLAAQVKADVPSSSPFKGMNANYYGRVQWQHPRVTVSITPGKKSIHEYSPLITLVATGGRTKVGFDYAEMAGVRKRPPRPLSRKYKRRTDSVERQHKVTTQGDNLIEKARQVSKYNFKAGHFAYGKFLSLRPQMILLALQSLDKTANEFNIKLRRR